MSGFKDILELARGDITRQQVDAIGNAANQYLAGGGGVDGAIHRAGGPALMQELREKYKGCPTGSAVMTGGGKLKAKYVLHAVGPRWKGGHRGEAQQLASAYRSSLQLARDHGCKTVAFPSISTGIYAYPVEEAAMVALTTVRDFLRENPGFEKIRFVLYDAATFRAYEEALKGL